jgi:hypothetical protein
MAGGRPRTGSLQRKPNGLLYASVAPRSGQPRKLIAFGRDEAAAQAWLAAAVAADAAGAELPDPADYRQAPTIGTQPMAAAPAVQQATLAGSPASQPGQPGDRLPVLGLAGAHLPGRGHDIALVFESWRTHWFHTLKKAGPHREAAVVTAWNDKLLPYLLTHGELVGDSGVFCVEELHLTLSGELRQHLEAGSATPVAAPTGPTLLGDGTVREVCERFGLPKSTVMNGLRRDRFPNASNDSGCWRIPFEDLRQAGLVGTERPARGRPSASGTGLGSGSVKNVMWILQKVAEHAAAHGIALQGNPTLNLASKSKATSSRASAQLVTLAQTRMLAGHLHVVHQLVLFLLRLVGVRISEVYGIHVRDLLMDQGEYGVLFIRGQGGRKFLVRRGDTVVEVDHVEELKNNESLRALVRHPWCSTSW